MPFPAMGIGLTRRSRCRLCAAFACVLVLAALTGCGSPRTPAQLFAAVEQNDAAAIASILKTAPDLVDCRDAHGDRDTPLIKALRGAHAAAAVSLLEYHANANLRGADGWPPLALAIAPASGTTLASFVAEAGDSHPAEFSSIERLAVTRALLDHGAQIDVGVNQIFEAGRALADQTRITTPLHEAVLQDNLPVIELLCTRGADLESQGYVHSRANAKVPYVGTPLFFAVENGNLAVARYLLDQGASANSMVRSPTLQLPVLWVAVMTGNLPITRLLLDHGANPNLQPWGYGSPLAEITRSRGGETHLVELMALLENHGLQVPAKDAGSVKKTQEYAAYVNTYNLARAQTETLRHFDYFQASGKALLKNGTLIAADLADAFERHNGNDDPETPSPKAGYIYRMLAGADNTPTSFADPQDRTHLTSFGATSRPADKTGWQYYVDAEATVYRHADPGTGKFLLDACPSKDQLVADNWTEVTRETIPPPPTGPAAPAYDTPEARCDTPLIVAARAGDESTVLAFITGLAIPKRLDQSNVLGETPLYVAIANGQVAVAAHLIDGGANANRMALSGFTPFHLAIINGQSALVKQMLEHGAEIDYPARSEMNNPFGLPPGALGERLMAILYKVDHEHPDLETFMGSSLHVAALPPAHLAALHGQVELLKTLLQHGAEDDSIVGPGRLFFMTDVTLTHCALLSGQPAMLEYLLTTRPEDRKTAAPTSFSLTMLAINLERPDMLEVLLKHGVDHNERNDEPGWSPMNATWSHNAKGPELRAVFKKYGVIEDNTIRLFALAANLHSIQHDYFKTHNAWAWSAVAAVGAVYPDMSAQDWPEVMACETCHGNDDAAKPEPYVGCVAQFLQGDGQNPVGFRVKPDSHELTQWAVVSRSVEPGLWQLLITADGHLYRRKDSGTGKFLVDALPTPEQLARDWQPLPPPYDHPLQYEANEPQSQLQPQGQP